MASAARSSRSVPPVEEVRERYREAEKAEAGTDRSRYVEAMKSFLATTERHADALAKEGTEVAPMLDEAAMAFYRASNPELAERAIDLGLRLSPGTATLLHHKALVLLSLNRDLPAVVKLTDQALEARPHDKSLWATRGDALRLLGQNVEAADSYLRAQELDAASTRYVDRALKLAPNHPRALRLKIELARSRGGDLPALAACDELLKENPEDLDLLKARAELLASLGRLDDGLEAARKVLAKSPDDRTFRLFEARMLFRRGRTDEAVPIAEALVQAKDTPDGAALDEIAQLAVETKPDLALAARKRLREVDPRNLQNLLDLKALAARLGDVDGALAACRSVLEVSPDNLEAMRGIAELEAAAGRTGQALEGYRAIVKAHPHATGEIRKGLTLAQEKGTPDTVREFAEALLAADANDVDARAVLATARAAAGDVPGALAALDALLAAHPGDVRYLLEKRTLLSASNDKGALAPVLDELFRLDPTRTDVAVERGSLYLGGAYDLPEGSAERESAARTALVSFERASRDPSAQDVCLLGLARASRLVDDPETALKAYSEFLGRGANSVRADIRQELAQTLREAGRFSEAAEQFEKTIAAGRDDSDLLWGAAEVYSHLNEDALSLRLLDLLLKREPGNPLYLRKKGQLFLRAGRRDEALRALRSAVEGARGDPHAHFEVGEALRAQGAYPDAITFYRQGLELDPRNRHGRLALAETLLLAGQYSEAIALVDPLLKEDPNDLAAWKARADAWRALGRPSEVLYSLRAILLLEPENPTGLLETYRLRREAGETKEAYEALSRLLQSNASEAHDPALHIERGDLASSLGLPEEANTAYERAASLDPAFRLEIALRRARLRLGAGRPDLALEVLEEGLKATPDASVPSLAALLLRAEILESLERPAEARAAFEQVRAREPKSPVALAGVARSMIAEGRHAEAVEFLRAAIPQLPPEESLYLLLAEGESGVGHLDRAQEAIQAGVALLPRSVSLWTRLGEVGIARQLWSDAANAFAHALANAPDQVDILLRAGFVAERLGHPNEALSFYDRAVQTAPNQTQAWTSRGVALLAVGRPADAQASFERALAIDSDFGPAKEGKKLAIQKTRDTEIGKHGREALLLEAKLHRTVTKNDLFVTLHVPYEFLDPVLQAIGRSPVLDLEHLDAGEVRDLETSSYHLIVGALERRPPGIERRGLSLADVAVLAPNLSLEQIQRLFGYLRAVLEADLKIEKLSLPPDVEELARQAITLPDDQRTLFQLVRTLRVGLLKARLIKAVEEAGSAVHAPLPSLDLGAYSPEFRTPPADATPAEGAVAVPSSRPAPLAVPAAGGALEPTAAPAEPSRGHHHADATEAPTGPHARCVGCGGIASLGHHCGAPLCQHCASGFPTCPKCGRPTIPESFHPLPSSAPSPAKEGPSHVPGGALGALKGVFRRSKGPATGEPHVARRSPAEREEPPAEKEAPPKGKAGPPTRQEKRKVEPGSDEGKAGGKDEAAPAPSGPAEPPAPPSRPKREKTDDEPRL
jgi:tetratricopeptide (TPR) repeat protein